MIYQFKEIDKTLFNVATNAGEAAAFRAPGHPQGSFGLETIMDLAAEALGMDPLELRMKNDRIRSGSSSTRKARRCSAGTSASRTAASPGPVKRGIGVASARWGANGGRGADVLCRIRKDGSVEVRNGAQDIGTGTRTIMAMVAAEELGSPSLGVTRVHRRHERSRRTGIGRQHDGADADAGGPAGGVPGGPAAPQPSPRSGA